MCIFCCRNRWKLFLKIQLHWKLHFPDCWTTCICLILTYLTAQTSFLVITSMIINSVFDSDVERVLKFLQINYEEFGNFWMKSDILNHVEWNRCMQFTIVHNSLKVILYGHNLPAGFIQFVLHWYFSFLGLSETLLIILVNQMILCEANDIVLNNCEWR